MQALRPTAGIRTRARHGRYVHRRLMLAGYADLARPLDEANQALVTEARRVEDLEIPLEDAHAIKDVREDHLDDTARLGRLKLANRSTDAVNESPYKDVFPEGIAEYTAARQSEQVVRYATLADRITTFLDEDDPLRAELPPQLATQLADWEASLKEVEQARARIALARSVRDAAVSRWEQVLVATYGALLGRVGKVKAERFFPKQRKKAKKAKADSVALPEDDEALNSEE